MLSPPAINAAAQAVVATAVAGDWAGAAAVLVGVKVAVAEAVAGVGDWVLAAQALAADALAVMVPVDVEVVEAKEIILASAPPVPWADNFSNIE